MDKCEAIVVPGYYLQHQVHNINYNYDQANDHDYHLNFPSLYIIHQPYNGYNTLHYLCVL